MSTINIKLDEPLLKRLRAVADSAGQTVEEAAGILLEEALRQHEFPGVHFRDTGIGRQAFVPGLRLPIYFLAELAREVRDDVDTIAEYYNITAHTANIALCYIRAFPGEIDRAIEDNEAAEDALVASLTADQFVTARDHYRLHSVI